MTNNWVFLGESVIGTSHRLRNEPCQDAFRCRAFGSIGEWLVVAVADGAGSASHADAGATLACDEFVRRVEELHDSSSLDSLFSRERVVELFAAVRQEVFFQAERCGVRPRELASTALLAVIGPGRAMFAQLGDGAIVLGSEQRRRVVFWPEPAEYANLTDFLTDERFATNIRFETTSEDAFEVAMFTDGLQRLALHFASRGPHLEFFDPLFRPLREIMDAEPLLEPLRAFLDSTLVNSRTDDDKTLVLAVRQHAYESAPAAG